MPSRPMPTGPIPIRLSDSLPIRSIAARVLCTSMALRARIIRPPSMTRRRTVWRRDDRTENGRAALRRVQPRRLRRGLGGDRLRRLAASGDFLGGRREGFRRDSLGRGLGDGGRGLGRLRLGRLGLGGLHLDRFSLGHRRRRGFHHRFGRRRDFGRGLGLQRHGFGDVLDRRCAGSAGTWATGAATSATGAAAASATGSTTASGVGAAMSGWVAAASRLIGRIQRVIHQKATAGCRRAREGQPERRGRADRRAHRLFGVEAEGRRARRREFGESHTSTP